MRVLDLGPEGAAPIEHVLCCGTEDQQLAVWSAMAEAFREECEAVAPFFGVSADESR